MHKSCWTNAFKLCAFVSWIMKVLTCPQKLIVRCLIVLERNCIDHHPRIEYFADGLCNLKINWRAQACLRIIFLSTLKVINLHLRRRISARSSRLSRTGVQSMASAYLSYRKKYCEQTMGKCVGLKPAAHSSLLLHVFLFPGLIHSWDNTGHIQSLNHLSIIYECVLESGNSQLKIFLTNIKWLCSIQFV